MTPAAVVETEEAIKVTTPFGTVVAQGFQAALLLAIGGLFWFMVEVGKRVDQAKCTTQLSIWVYTQPRGQMPSNFEMPVDLWGCIPAFMYDASRRK